MQLLDVESSYKDKKLTLLFFVVLGLNSLVWTWYTFRDCSRKIIYNNTAKDQIASLCMEFVAFTVPLLLCIAISHSTRFTPLLLRQNRGVKVVEQSFMSFCIFTSIDLLHKKGEIHVKYKKTVLKQLHSGANGIKIWPCNCILLIFLS